MSRHFSKEYIQMASEYLKTCSASLAFREMQVKAVLRSNLTPVSRMATIKKLNDKFWWECRKENCYLSGAGAQTCAATMEIRMMVPKQNLKTII